MDLNYHLATSTIHTIYVSRRIIKIVHFKATVATIVPPFQLRPRYFPPMVSSQQPTHVPAQTTVKAGLHLLHNWLPICAKIHPVSGLLSMSLLGIRAKCTALKYHTCHILLHLSVQRITGLIRLVKIHISGTCAFSANHAIFASNDSFLE